MSGQLDVLSVGHGHLKITITEGDAVEIEKARRIITDMLERGYSIFVEQPDGSTKRVKKFDPKKMVYVIDDTMETVPAKKAPPRKQPTKEVPVAQSKATAVGRTAGG